ncbi:MAG: hypothetical protein HDT46_07380 [Ruminococcaceae bacterium]|nr:hypothetical protein [Oscillospiraceae bacterium]
MKKYKKILFLTLLVFSLCGCSQITAEDARNNAYTVEENEIISNMPGQNESDNTSFLNSTDDANEQTDSETQTQEEHQLAQLRPYIDELEKINDEFSLDLVMCLSDTEETAGAYNEFCSMSIEEFRDEIISRIRGDVSFIADENGILNPKPHYIDVDEKEHKLAQLQPYIDELEKINEELGVKLEMGLYTPYQIAASYNEYCSESIEEFRDHIIKLYNGEITITYDEYGNKTIHYADNSEDIEDFE